MRPSATSPRPRLPARASRPGSTAAAPGVTVSGHPRRRRQARLSSSTSPYGTAAEAGLAAEEGEEAEEEEKEDGGRGVTGAGVPMVGVARMV